ncbi:hypothetical protein N7478_008682 [Penicillium angulare]|uniref:uncharacterized protein n=1 Tax=Penicillium angulare TaxID=116970 RepID=UPI002541D5F7|nr:uncharacterized protein N7478_008682 [Penicillium angulare]KAJ5273557.1 hypothetical protein N7478_008682 [Penicillium angulare]
MEPNPSNLTKRNDLMHGYGYTVQRQPEYPLLPYPPVKDWCGKDMRIILRLQAGTGRRTPTRPTLEETLDRTMP